MDGPCLLVRWREAKAKSPAQGGRYFPADDEKQSAAEEVCFEWFASRRIVVVSMVWGWGEIPANVTKRHRLVLG